MVDDDDTDPRSFPDVTGEAKQDVAALIAARRAEAVAKATKIIEARRGAYTRVFMAGTPTQEDRELVRRDLATFCRGNASAWDKDERIHCLLTGRQEVHIRIEDFTRLDLDTLLGKYGPPEE